MPLNAQGKYVPVSGAKTRYIPLSQRPNDLKAIQAQLARQTKIDTLKTQADVATKEAGAAADWKVGFKPSNLWEATKAIAKQTYEHPIETAKTFGKGLLKGAILEPMEAVQRMVTPKDQQHLIKPVSEVLPGPPDSEPVLQGIEQGGVVTGYVAPYSAGAKVTQGFTGLVKGLPLVAKFLAKPTSAVKIINKILPGAEKALGFVGTGQVLYNPNDEEEGSRAERAMMDLVGFGIFEGLGAATKYILKPAARAVLGKLKAGKTVTLTELEAGAKEAAKIEEAVVPKEKVNVKKLQELAVTRSKELEEKAVSEILTTQEMAERQFLSDAKTTTQDLAKKYTIQKVRVPEVAQPTTKAEIPAAIEEDILVEKIAKPKTKARTKVVSDESYHADDLSNWLVKPDVIPGEKVRLSGTQKGLTGGEVTFDAKGDVISVKPAKIEMMKNPQTGEMTPVARGGEITVRDSKGEIESIRSERVNGLNVMRLQEVGGESIAPRTRKLPTKAEQYLAAKQNSDGTITIYRGVKPGGEQGTGSFWTTNKKVASFYAKGIGEGGKVISKKISLEEAIKGFLGTEGKQGKAFGSDIFSLESAKLKLGGQIKAQQKFEYKLVQKAEPMESIAIPEGKDAQAVKEAIEQIRETPIDELKPTIVESLIKSITGSTKRYEKRIAGHLAKNALADVNQLGFIARALKIGMPMRQLASADPVASYAASRLRGAVSKQQFLYDNAFLKNKDWAVLDNLSPEEGARVVKLQESGVDIKTLSGADAINVQAIRNLEKLAYEMTKETLVQRYGAEEAAKIMKGWRYTPENHFYRLWAGDQALLDIQVIPKGAKGTKGYKLYDKKNNLWYKLLDTAKGRGEALEKLVQHEAVNPPTDTSYRIIRPRFELNKGQMPVGLSSKQFFTLMGKLATALETDVTSALQEINMQGIAKITPGKTKLGFLQFRTGELNNYIKDPGKVYPQIFWKLTKAVAVDPEIKQVAGIIGKIKDKEIKEIITELMEVVNGKYSPSVIPGKMVSLITGFQAVTKMGFRLAPAIINATQRLYSIALTGGKNFGSAQKQMFTEEGQAILKKGKIDMDTVVSENRSTRKENWFSRLALSLFNLTEQNQYLGNRGVSFLAGYKTGMDLDLKLINKNLKKLGLPQYKNQEELAIAFGRNVVDVTQIRYDVSDKPALFRKPLWKILGQFKTYGINSLVNTAAVIQGKVIPGLEQFYPNGLTRSQQLRQLLVHFGVMFSMGGLKAASFGAEKVLPAATLYWLATKHPNLFLGIPAFFGVDLSASSAVEVGSLLGLDSGEETNPFWKAVSIVGGVTGSDAIKFKNAIVEKKPELLVEISPALYRMYQIVDSMENNDYLRNLETKQNIMKLNKVEQAQMALGLLPLKVSQERFAHSANIEQSTESSEKVSRYKEEILDNMLAGNLAGATEIITEAKEEGYVITVAQLKDTFMNRILPRLMRDIQKARKEDRPDMLKQLQDFQTQSGFKL